MKMQASVIAPVVALIGLVVQLLFGVRLAEEQMEIITNGIVAITLLVSTAAGAYKIYKEKKQSDKTYQNKKYATKSYQNKDRFK